MECMFWQNLWLSDENFDLYNSVIKHVSLIIVSYDKIIYLEAFLVLLYKAFPVHRRNSLYVLYQTKYTP